VGGERASDGLTSFAHAHEGGDAEREVGEDAEEAVRQEALEGEVVRHLVHGEREAVVERAAQAVRRDEHGPPREPAHQEREQHLRRDAGHDAHHQLLVLLVQVPHDVLRGARRAGGCGRARR
jgi:hypothetical protein